MAGDAAEGRRQHEYVSYVNAKHKAVDESRGHVPYRSSLEEVPSTNLLWPQLLPWTQGQRGDRRQISVTAAKVTPVLVSAGGRSSAKGNQILISSLCMAERQQLKCATGNCDYTPLATECRPHCPVCLRGQQLVAMCLSFNYKSSEVKWGSTGDRQRIPVSIPAFFLPLLSAHSYYICRSFVLPRVGRVLSLYLDATFGQMDGHRCPVSLLFDAYEWLAEQTHVESSWDQSSAVALTSMWAYKDLAVRDWFHWARRILATGEKVD
ncbi:hypothetical protein JOB18_003713 [Solea senegalensis]|uniref:Uncharacterized protein n=1 Tax=Solea senegalensis TaxID=28829 RepID=A0AAV6QLT6_SOLSE|nr:hypothetical protein JOB18_003713 [Solea senegalensis]